MVNFKKLKDKLSITKQKNRKVGSNKKKEIDDITIDNAHEKIDDVLNVERMQNNDDHINVNSKLEENKEHDELDFTNNKIGKNNDDSLDGFDKGVKVEDNIDTNIDENQINDINENNELIEDSDENELDIESNIDMDIEKLDKEDSIDDITENNEEDGVELGDDIGLETEIGVENTRDIENIELGDDLSIDNKGEEKMIDEAEELNIDIDNNDNNDNNDDDLDNDLDDDLDTIVGKNKEYNEITNNNKEDDLVNSEEDDKENIDIENEKKNNDNDSDNDNIVKKESEEDDKDEAKNNEKKEIENNNSEIFNKENGGFFGKIKNFFSKGEKKEGEGNSFNNFDDTNGEIYYKKEDKLENTEYLESMKVKLYSIVGILILFIVGILFYNISFFANDNYSLYKKYLKEKLSNKNKKTYILKLENNYKGIKELLDKNDLVVIQPEYFKKNIIQHLDNMIRIVKENKGEDENLVSKISYKGNNISINIINIKYYDTIKKIMLKIRQLQRYYIIRDLGINIDKRKNTYNLSLKLEPVVSLYLKK